MEQPSTDGAHTWPEACPDRSESSFLSVYVLSTHYHFAFHREKSKFYQPDTFWRVPIASIPDDHDESNDQAPSKIIGYIPPIARGLFFPPPEECTEVPTVAEAIDYMVTSKAAPVVSLYVICGIDPQANRNLQKLFERYPVRITWLKSTDFCPQKSLPFPGVSTCTVAAVYGALQLPGLIIESGNSINLTTVDENGHVVVASVVMGSFSHFENAIQDDSGAEGIGDSPDANELVNNFLKRNQPLLDADPNVDRLCGIQPLLHTIFQLMKNFVEKYGPSDSDDGNILIHGSHGRVLHSLLQEENLSYISKELVSCFIPKVKLDDHLVHRGIGNMLMHYDKLVTPGSDREKCLHFVGRRVARAFPQDYMDPDQAVTYRGVVSSFVSVKNGDAWDDNMFEVIYDDGDREELNVEELYEALRLYCLVGERLLLVSTSDATRSKKEASQAAARSLVIWSAKIQRALERHQVTPSDRSSGSEEMEGKSISRGSRNRKQAGWLLKSMSSNRRGRTAKKPRTQTTRKRESFLKTSSAKKQLPADQSPSSFEGRRIAKRFDEGLFFGTIVSHRVDKRTTYWHVQYDDDDAEDLDYDEVLQQTALFESYSEQSLSDAISISDGK